MGDNIVDKVVSDNNRLVITNKAVKWIMGILISGVVSLLGLAWGLYVTLDAKVDKMDDDMNDTILETKVAIIDKMEELDKEKVKPNSDKNYKQDLDIVRLYERTNSRGETINHNTSRPEILDTSSASSALPGF